MQRPRARRVMLLAASLAAATLLRSPAQPTFHWDLPPGFPQPFVPPDNPMSVEKVALGRRLFYDTRLSGNGTQACASCHQPARAFTDGRPVSVGSTGEPHPRGSMSVANVAYASSLTWGDRRVTRLEDQAITPMHGEHPVEMGLPMDGTWLGRLQDDSEYAALFRAAYPWMKEPVTDENVRRAIASFERTLISDRSPYDRYQFDRDDSVMSAAAKRGEALFRSETLACSTCHSGFNLSGPTISAAQPQSPAPFHNIGLYNLVGTFSYPPRNRGLYDVTGDPRDVGKFKVPTLRNIAVTAPYMHDGSVATLRDAIAHYAAGGRTIAEGPYAGVGRDNPLKNPAIAGFTITDAERDDLIAFLESLTDDAFLRDPRFQNPFTARPR